MPRRLIRTALLALLLGGALGAIEALVILGRDPSLRLRAPLAELGQLAGRTGVLAALVATGLASLFARWPSSRAALHGAALVLFVLGGVWLHSRVLQDEPLLAPLSLGATLALALGCLTLAAGGARLAHRPALFGGILALALCVPTVLVLGANAGRAPASPAPAPPPGGSLPDVTLVVIDTLRADRLGCYGYRRSDGRPTSPVIDALAARGVLFTEAYSASPWTRPAVASIFTGLHPSSHRTNDVRSVLPPDCVTLAEMFRARGYRTGGFAANGNVSPVFGFDQGFDRFWCRFDATLLEMSAWGELAALIRRRLGRESEGAHAGAVNRRALEWLRRPSERPTFTYVHYLDPHAPYAPPEDLLNERPPLVDVDLTGIVPPAAPAAPFPEGRSEPPAPPIVRAVLNAYDAEIRFCDRALGALVEALEERGLLDEEDFLVVTSDHGEEFFEHGLWGHGHSMFDEVVRVPLVVVGPGLTPGTRREEPVCTLDLWSTLGRWIDHPLPATAPGRPLPGLASGASLEDATSPVVLAEHLDPRGAIPWLDHRDLLMVRRGRWKLITVASASGGDATELLFDLELDGEERQPVLDVPELRELRGALAEARRAALERAMEPPAAPLPLVRRALRGLGYAGLEDD